VEHSSLVEELSAVPVELVKEVVSLVAQLEQKKASATNIPPPPAPKRGLFQTGQLSPGEDAAWLIPVGGVLVMAVAAAVVLATERQREEKAPLVGGMLGGEGLSDENSDGQTSAQSPVVAAASTAGASTPGSPQCSYVHLCPEVVVPDTKECQLFLHKSDLVYNVVDAWENPVLKLRMRRERGAHILELLSTQGTTLAKARRAAAGDTSVVLQLLYSDDTVWGEVTQQRGQRGKTSTMTISNQSYKDGKEPYMEIQFGHTKDQIPMKVFHCPTKQVVAEGDSEDRRYAAGIYLRPMADAAVILCTLVGVRCLNEEMRTVSHLLENAVTDGERPAGQRPERTRRAPAPSRS